MCLRKKQSQKCYLTYHARPTRNRKVKVDQAKKAPDDAHLSAEAAFILGKINDLSNQHVSKRHHLAWKTIQELSASNSISSIEIKCGSVKTRLENWKAHFQNLLGKKPNLPKDNSLPIVQFQTV